MADTPDAPRAPPASVDATTRPGALSDPWRVGDFRRLVLVFLVNGIATAVPAKRSSRSPNCA
jgi:hypothetical protein